MDIELTPKLSQLIEEKLASEMYATPEKVVEAALAALDEEEVCAAIAEGYEDVLAGRCRSWMEADAEFRKSV